MKIIGTQGNDLIMGEGAGDILTGNIRAVGEAEEEVAVEEGEILALHRQRLICRSEHRKNGPNWKKR